MNFAINKYGKIIQSCSSHHQSDFIWPMTIKLGLKIWDLGSWESTWCRQHGWRISRRRRRDVCPDHSPPPSPWAEILMSLRISRCWFQVTTQNQKTKAALPEKQFTKYQTTSRTSTRSWFKVNYSSHPNFSTSPPWPESGSSTGAPCSCKRLMQPADLRWIYRDVP